MVTLEVAILLTLTTRNSGLHEWSCRDTGFMVALEVAQFGHLDDADYERGVAHCKLCRECQSDSPIISQAPKLLQL